MSSATAEGPRWHGIPRRYLRADGARSDRLASLASQPLQWDRVGVLTAWGLADAPERTVLRGISTDIAQVQVPAPPDDGWTQIFEAEVARLARSVEAPVVALGGGLDAAAVLVAWRECGVPLPEVVTLHTGLPDYDEVDQADAIGRALGVAVRAIDVPLEALWSALPDAVAWLETPLYNLHPVGRLALARAVRARGCGTLITGDGADAAFAGRPDWDYVPLVAALTGAAGLRLASPFLAGRTLAATLAMGRDPEKRPLRHYLAQRGFPQWLVAKPKRPRWVPCPSPLQDLPPAAQVTRSRLDALAAEIDLPVDLEPQRGLVSWVSLGLLSAHLEGVA
jgi:hypothetical protein